MATEYTTLDGRKKRRGEPGWNLTREHEEENRKRAEDENRKLEKIESDIREINLFQNDYKDHNHYTKTTYGPDRFYKVKPRKTFIAHYPQAFDTKLPAKKFKIWLSVE